MSVTIYDPPMPIDRLCTYCSKPLVVTGAWNRSMVINGERDWIFAHADDLKTECVRTLKDTVRPYDGWGIREQIDEEQRRRWAAKDALLAVPPTDEERSQ